MTPIGSLCLYHGTQGRTDDDNNNNHHHHTVHESPVSDPTTLRRCLLHFLVDAPSCDPFEQRRTTDVDQLFNAFLCVLEGQHTRTTGGKHVPVPYLCYTMKSNITKEFRFSIALHGIYSYDTNDSLSVEKATDP